MEKPITEEQFQTLFRRCWRTSILCYAISFLLPVYSIHDGEIVGGQGFFMFFGGILSISLHPLFFSWLANPIFLVLQSRIASKYNKDEDFVSTSKMRKWGLTAVVFASLFVIYGKMMVNEGGSMHPILAYHLGHWLWEASMMFLAMALMAKSEPDSASRYIVDWYLRLTSWIPYFIKVSVAVLLAIIIQWWALVALNVC